MMVDLRVDWTPEDQGKNVLKTIFLSPYSTGNWVCVGYPTRPIFHLFTLGSRWVRESF